MEKFDDILGGCAERTLKKRFIKRFKENNKPEAVWFTTKMKDSIKLRRQYNRLVRNASNNEDKATFKILYDEQKRKTSMLIKEGISNYEIKITERLKQQNNSTDMWKDINKLRRREEDKKDKAIYDDEGKPMEKDKIGEVVCNYWRGIYQPDENKIHIAWNEDKKENYNVELEEENKIKIEFAKPVPDEIRYQYRAVREMMQRIGLERPEDNLLNRESKEGYVEAPAKIREHLDMAGRTNIEEYIERMEKVKFTQEDVREQISRMKIGRQPGPDKLKPEIYKWFNYNNICINILTECMNKILDDSEPPIKWKKSKTTLIPKKQKPKPNELRPIALTNVSYKLFMGLVKKTLVNHLERNDKISEFQSGFTKSRRLEDNILILKYCIGESKRLGTPLILTAIDFSKAFDSIDRRKLILTLIKYKCDARLIDVIAKLYTEDSTNLFFNEENLGEIEVTAGIRQGCTGSPWLFVMAVNQIIDKIVKTKLGFKNDDHYIPALFYADDGILLAQNIKEAKSLIKALEEAADDIGLKINRGKCNVLVFNMKDKPKEIENIAVVREIKYLGVVINDTKDCFKTYKIEKIKFAQKMANMTYSVIARSCNKLLIGKAYWKSIVLPSLLFASSVVAWDKESLGKMQKCENSVWRHILGCPGYTPICAMRGDIGASTMDIREMKTKLKYVRYIMNGPNELLKNVFVRMYNDNKDTLIKGIKMYLQRLKIDSLNNLIIMNEKNLLTLIKEYDNKNWLEELEEKSTLQLYRNFKKAISAECFFDNTYESALLFKARSNTLKLDWRKRFEGGDVQCKLCRDGTEETQEHFFLYCKKLEGIRRKYCMEGIGLQDILMFSSELEANTCKRFIGAMWKGRLGFLSEI